MNYIFGIKVFGLQIINVVLIDIAIILTKMIGDTLSTAKSIGTVSAIILMLFVGFEPLFIVPYTDTYSLVPALLTFYLIIDVIKNREKWFAVLEMIMAGCTLAISYLMRPSTVVFVIAIAILEIFMINDSDGLKKILFRGGSMTGALVCVVLLFGVYTKQQTI